MGKNKPTLARPTQRMTKRERSHWEKERRIQRNLILIFGAVGVLSILLIGIALLYDNVLQPGRVVARVNNEPIYLRDYWGARRMQLINQYQQQMQTFSLYAQYGITLTEDQQNSFQQNLRTILLDLGQVTKEKVDDATIQDLIKEKTLTQGARDMGFNPAEQDVVNWLYEQNQPAPTPTPEGSPFGETGSPTETASVTPTVQPTVAPTLSPQQQSDQLVQQWGLFYEELRTVMKNYAAGDLGFSRSEYIALVNHSLRVSYLQQKVQDKLSETMNKTEDQVHASQILIADRAARAQEAEQAVKSGQSFPQMVVKYTDDEAGRNKIGDIGWLYRGDVYPSLEVENAAFAITETNGLSPVVADANGLSIVQRLERDDSKAGVHVRQIVLPLDRRSLADDVLKALQGGADFAQTAQARSEDEATGPSGGDLGWLTKDSTAQSQAVVQAAFTLSGTNALSPVVEDDAGYHILQLLESDATKGQHVRQILILKAPAFAEKVLQQIKNGAIDFSQAAASYSIDVSTVGEAGDLGWITRDDTTLPKAVVDAAWAITETNGISPLFQDGSGVYHIVQVWERNDPENKIRVREIVIKPAEQLAEEIRSYVLAGGADNLSPRFFDQARRYSNDTQTNSKGGDLGWFGRGAHAEIEQVAFDQNPGDVSQPFQTTSGYYIVWTRERDANHPVSEDVLKTRIQAAYDEWLKQLTDAATIQRFPPSTPTPVPTAVPEIESTPALTGTVTP